MPYGTINGYSEPIDAPQERYRNVEKYSRHLYLLTKHIGFAANKLLNDEVSQSKQNKIMTKLHDLLTSLKHHYASSMALNKCNALNINFAVVKSKKENTHAEEKNVNNTDTTTWFSNLVYALSALSYQHKVFPTAAYFLGTDDGEGKINDEMAATQQQGIARKIFDCVLTNGEEFLKKVNIFTKSNTLIFSHDKSVIYTITTCEIFRLL